MKYLAFAIMLAGCAPVGTALGTLGQYNQMQRSYYGGDVTYYPNTQAYDWVVQQQALAAEIQGERDAELRDARDQWRGGWNPSSSE